jgi:hypothetical protein
VKGLHLLYTAPRSFCLAFQQTRENCLVIACISDFKRHYFH